MIFIEFNSLQLLDNEEKNKRETMHLNFICSIYINNQEIRTL